MILQFTFDVPLVEKYKPQSYRLLILANNYLQTINYDDEIMLQMQSEWEKIDKVYTVLYRKLELENALVLDRCAKYDLMENFLKGMANNFNTSLALTAVYDLMKNINRDLRNKNIGHSIKVEFQIRNTDFLV